jgi:hypothetical protein
MIMVTSIPALPLVVQIEQPLVTARGSLVLSVEQAGGQPYTGYLDYDQLVLPLGVTDLRKSVVHSGPWGTFFVSNGMLTIDVDHVSPGGKLADGIYIARFRPHGSDGPFSNQIGYAIDRAARPVSEDVDNNGGRYIVPQPVAGAYVVYRDEAADGSLNGYTRIEFEAQGESTEIVQRFTKTASTAYWGPSGNPADQSVATLRWQIAPSATNPQNFKALVGFLSHFDRTNDANTSLAHTRSGEDAMGNLGRIGMGQTVAAFVGPSPLFYTLAPVHLFPEKLDDDFTPIIDRLVKYDAAGGVLNNWHVEVRASQLGGMYEVRYVEWALGGANLSTRPQFDSTPSASVNDWGVFFRWSVLEDWDWNADGTLNRITQRGNSRAHTTVGTDDLPPDCWRVPGGCDKSNRHTLTPLRRYVPDRRAHLLQWAATTFPGWGLERLINYVAEHFGGARFMPLHIGFVDAAGDEVTELTIAPDEPWTLRVRTADDEPYDGFLQVRQPSGPPQVWADQRSYPIYVHDGQIEALPEAFSFAPGMTMTLEMRQQLLNEHIAADIALADLVQPTNQDMPFSNQIQLTIMREGNPAKA